MLKRAWPVILLLGLEILLFKANYVPGTWLLGWDATIPELNIKLNLARNLSAVWQEYRGVGILDGMAHAANIVHTSYISLLSLFLKTSVIRYVFIFLMHFLGGAGAYFLCRRLLGSKTWRTQIISLTASIFYLLNAGTIQMFYTPLELFIIHFGFLPWLLWALIGYLESGRRRDLLILFLINLAAVSQAHVPTVFIVYLAAVGVFLAVRAIASKFLNLKRSLLAASVILAANFFWAAPYVYSALHSSKEISNSKINLLSNPEVILRNRDFGTFADTALLRGFSLNYQDWVGEDDYGYQFETWRSHFYKPWVERVGYVFFALAGLGVTLAFVKRKPYLIAASFLLVFAFANLATEVPAGSFVRELLLRIPFYKEAFRFVFTKFIILYALAIAVLSAYALSAITNLRLKVLAPLAALLLIFGQIYAAIPAFGGEFLYPKLKVELPEEYQEAIQFFETLPEGRVVVLPAPSFWNWDYLKWSYRGSGFLWQGIKQASFHRSFDPWNAQNETFYTELSRAIYIKDGEVLLAVLDKYQVKYILFDENIFIPGGFDESEYNDWLRELFAVSGFTELTNLGPISVYQTDLGGQHVWAPEVFGRFDTDSKYSPVDTVFDSYGNYVNDAEGTTFPFVNFDKRMGVRVEDLGDRVQVASRQLQFRGRKDLVYPELLIKGKSTTPAVFVNADQKVEVSLSLDQKTSADLANPEQESIFQNCDLKEVGSVERRGEGGKVHHLAQNGGVACEFFDFPDLSHSAGYVLHVKGENKTGRSLKFYLQNWQTGRMELEELLPEREFDEYYFVLPRRTDEGGSTSGYSLNLETRSFGRIDSENVVESIEFIPVPIEWLRQIRLEPTLQGDYSIQNNLKILDVKKTGTWLYRIQVEGDGLLVLGQGYEPGWLGFKLKSVKTGLNWFDSLDDVRVNSWANGWPVSTSFNQSQPVSTVYLVFWPQLLEYLGFGVLALTLVTLCFDLRLKRRYTTY